MQSTDSLLFLPARCELQFVSRVGCFDAFVLGVHLKLVRTITNDALTIGKAVSHAMSSSAGNLLLRGSPHW
jgi:hypothetical protein